MKKLLMNKKTLIVLISTVLAVCCILFNAIKVSLKNDSDELIKDNKIDGINFNDYYDIPSNPTDFQKELYQELSDVIVDYRYEGANPEYHSNNQKEKEICTVVVKNFIADFYTLSNKNSTYDVGGMEFTDKNNGGIYLNARDSYYKDLDGYIYQYGRENLPIVDSIIIETAYGGEANFFGEMFSYFYSEAIWTYKESEYDLSDFSTRAGFWTIWDSTNESWRVAKIVKAGE